MSVRAAVVLLEEERVCLIRRNRNASTYYLFPGGGTDPGETPAEAAEREAFEELGLEVHIGPLLARMCFAGNEQLYFHASVAGGTFGTGTGEELASPPQSETGSYTPVWLPLSDLACHDVRPRHLAEILADDAWRSFDTVVRLDDRS